MVYVTHCQRGHEIEIDYPNAPLVYCPKCWKENAYPWSQPKDVEERSYLYANPDTIVCKIHGKIKKTRLGNCPHCEWGQVTANNHYSRDIEPKGHGVND